jgi:hypothetical protein
MIMRYWAMQLGDSIPIGWGVFKMGAMDESERLVCSFLAGNDLELIMAYERAREACDKMEAPRHVR